MTATRSGALMRAAGAAAARAVRGSLFTVGHLEGVPAAASSDDVRVVDLEPGLLEAVQEVDLGAAQVRSTERVDDELDAVRLELVIAFLRAAVEAERVFESR